MFGRDPLANPQALIRRVYRYVSYRVGEGAEAEDITSETFERALRYRASYKPSQGEPIGWLIGIARRCIADAVNARLELIEAEDSVAADGDLAADAAVRLDVAAAVATLDPRSREIVALRYGADLTARQIAELLGLKTNAVEVALHRAVARLRVLLEAEDEAGRGGVSRTPSTPDLGSRSSL